MIWKPDRADRLVEGNLRRIYGAPPTDPLPQAAQHLLDRLHNTLVHTRNAAQSDDKTPCH